MIDRHKAQHKNHVWRLIKIIGLCMLIFVLLGLLFVITSSYFFGKIFDGRFKFRECEPEALISDLERVFDINFPAEIRQVKAARTSGSWDAPNTTSFFNLKFYAEPDIVNTFLKLSKIPIM